MAQDKKQVQLTMIDLAATAGNAGVLQWRPARVGAFVVHRIELDILTPSTGACTVDVGVAAAATSNDSLIDGLSIATAGLYDNLKNPGTNGKASQKLTSSQYVTGTVASGTVTGLVGKAYVVWHAL